MALPATLVLEVRTTGSDTNGGGFNPALGGHDYSQQDAAQVAVTDAVTTAGSATVTSASASFPTDCAGSSVYIAGGSSSLTGDVFHVATRNSATSITLDRAPSAGSSGTGATLNLGGAFATPGWAASIANKTGGIDAWIKSGTYTATTASTNVAGGCLSLTGNAGAVNNPVVFEGYHTTRGDRDGTRPTIVLNAGVTSATVVALGAARIFLKNIILDAASQTTSTTLSVNSTSCAAVLVKVQNATVNGCKNNNNDAIFFRCEATGCSGTAAFNNAVAGTFSCCEAYGNTTHGFQDNSANAGSFINCISSGNTGSTTDGFNLNGRSESLNSCVAYGNGRHGYNFNNIGFAQAVNCLAEGHTAVGAYGFTSSGGVNLLVELVNCGGYNNNAGNVNTTNLPNTLIGFVTGSSSFFTNAAAGDFSLNSTAGGGASARSAGYPGQMPRGTSGLGYGDIGAIQHQDAGGGGAVLSRIFTGF